MGNEVLIRLTISGVLIATGIFIYLFFTRWTIRRSKAHISLPERLKLGKPAILYFTTPNCHSCITIQRPALNTVKEQMGENLQIIEIDAYTQPDIASAWNVLSVPTTYIIDVNGTPRHVNHGVTRAEKLLQQINDIS